MQSWSGRLALVIALLAATLHGQAPADLAGLTFNAHVVGIVDGDTLDVLKADTKRTVRIRLDGIDTPERGEPFTQQARNLTRVLAFDQDVIVVGKDVDRYGRLVARVRLGRMDLSVEIVTAGLACHFLRYSSDPVLATAEADARSAGRADTPDPATMGVDSHGRSIRFTFSSSTHAPCPCAARDNICRSPTDSRVAAK